MEWRHIQMARRVLASERGAIVKDWGGQLPIALVYPNSYAVGMSSLAMHGLYRLLNAQPGILCERAFATLSARARPADPVLTLESQRAIADLAVIAFTVSFEMDYLNIVAILRRAQVPLRAEERREGDPLVLLGGPAISANPEPLALLADAIVIGEGEPLLEDLAAGLRGAWTEARADLLAELARLPGVYVPLLHEGQPIRRLWLEDLDAYPLTTSVIAPRAEFGDMYLIEMARGCGRGCRFCLAGYWYRPPRERALESLLEQAREGLRYLPKIGLVASAVSDYARIEELVTALRRMGAQLSVSSLRVKPLSPVLVRALEESGAQAFTLAPEAGSERLRCAVNKGVTHDDILEATRLAAAHRFETLKLYFMVGLPGETDDDIDDLLRLVAEIRGLFPRHIVINVTPFVPKAHTPYERVAMAPAETLRHRLSLLRERLGQMRIELRAETVAEACVQGILARGDRAVGRALLDMPRPSLAHWERAMARAGLEAEAYLRERAIEETLPWDFVASGIRRSYLTAERQRSERQVQTEACNVGACRRCGVCDRVLVGGGAPDQGAGVRSREFPSPDAKASGFQPGEAKLG